MLAVEIAVVLVVVLAVLWIPNPQQRKETPFADPVVMAVRKASVVSAPIVKAVDEGIEVKVRFNFAATTNVSTNSVSPMSLPR